MPNELAIFRPAKKRRKNTFPPTLHPLSQVIYATATVVAFVLLRSPKFNLVPLLYTAWSNAYSEIGPEVTLRPLVASCAKDYKGLSLVQISFTEPPNKIKVENSYSLTPRTDVNM